MCRSRRRKQVGLDVVDITLNAPGVESQQSARQFPFNAEDALTLIGGRTTCAGMLAAARHMATSRKQKSLTFRIIRSSLIFLRLYQNAAPPKAFLATRESFG